MLWPFDEVNSNIDERVVESVSVSEEAVAPLSQRRMVRLWTPWGSGPQPEEEAVAPLSQRRMVRLWTPWGSGPQQENVTSRCSFNGTGIFTWTAGLPFPPR
jgi:hypothetical protein